MRDKRVVSVGEIGNYWLGIQEHGLGGFTAETWPIRCWNRRLTKIKTTIKKTAEGIF